MSSKCKHRLKPYFARSIGKYMKTFVDANAYFILDGSYFF